MSQHVIFAQFGGQITVGQIAIIALVVFGLFMIYRINKLSAQKDDERWTEISTKFNALCAELNYAFDDDWNIYDLQAGEESQLEGAAQTGSAKRDLGKELDAETPQK